MRQRRDSLLCSRALLRYSISLASLPPQGTNSSSTSPFKAAVPSACHMVKEMSSSKPHRAPSKVVPVLDKNRPSRRLLAPCSVTVDACTTGSEPRAPSTTTNPRNSDASSP